MSRKHYRHAAEIVRTYPNKPAYRKEREAIYWAFVRLFSNEPNFNSLKFEEACWK